MKKFDAGFTPAFTPHQMLQLGVFEGKYLNSTMSEYPNSWKRGAKLCDVADPEVNAFGVKSRQPTSVWLANGWIHPQDPHGWFQWYCRYYTGRRTDDDARQIKRWRAFVRHSAQVVLHGGGRIDVRRVQRQALLQWSHNPFPDVRKKSRATIFEQAINILRSSTTS